jgi:sulfite reductase alpha subunit-like flavoprotein
MVGPGTGVAPFRSYINDIRQPLDNLVLFFGCRNREGDFHFKDEWDSKKDLKLFTAFSRDQPHKM